MAYDGLVSLSIRRVGREGRLIGRSKQPLPMVVFDLQTVLFTAAHQLQGHHRNSAFEVTNGEVSVSAHKALDTAQCDLAM